MRESWDGDRDPLAALASGQPQLFEDFVTTETGSLLGFFRRLGAGTVEAEDLVQETILKLFRAAKNYQSVGRFEAYAVRAARNVWVDSLRRSSVREQAGSAADEDAPQALDQVAGSEPEPFYGLAMEERSELLLQAVGRLDELHREAFELGVMQGLPYAEVSLVLGVPVGTVKSRVYHAVKRLREDLERRSAL